MQKNIIRLAVGTGILLLIPLVLTFFNPNAHMNGGMGGGWDWEPGDFVFAGVMIFGTGLAFLLVARKANTKAYRIATGLALAAGFLIVWVNGAVGIIGNEDRPANLLYFGALLIGVVGALIARFQPRGMARAMFTTAVLLFFIPIIALLVWRPTVTVEAAGILGVFILNSFFVALFTVAGLLFRQASIADSK